MQLSPSTRVIGQHFEFHSTIDSTNRRCKELAEANAPHGTCVAASAQSQGRGQRGRQWASPENSGLYVSFLIRSKLPLRLTPLITLTTAVSLTEMLKSTLSYQPGIKWPNDLLDPASRRKLAGILVEASSSAATLNYAVIGIGLNLKTSALPSELRSYAIGLDQVTPQAFDPSSLLSGLCERLEADLDTLLSGDSTSILTRWNASALDVGKTVGFHDGTTTIHGRFDGLNSDGGVLLDQKPYYSGELLLPGAPRRPSTEHRD